MEQKLHEAIIILQPTQKSRISHKRITGMLHRIKKNKTKTEHDVTVVLLTTKT